MSRSDKAGNAPVSSDADIKPFSPLHDRLSDFQNDLARMTVVELRHKYGGERETHERILREAKSNPARTRVHPEFRRFRDFLRHVGPKGGVTRTLDRIDFRDPEYGPGKVRWATKREQANNRSNTITLRDKHGTVRPLTEWAQITGQNPDTMRKRYQRGGWAEEEIVEGRRMEQYTRPAKRAPAPSPEANPWPPGVPENIRNGWAAAYVQFQRALPEGKRHDLTRALFTHWALEPRIMSQVRRVQSIFPCYVEGEEDVPAGFSEHGEVRRLLSMRECQLTAACMVRPQVWVWAKHWLRSSPALNPARRLLGLKEVEAKVADYE